MISIIGALCYIRFSQFFVSPLVKIEAMEREVQAVDSGACHSYLSLLISIFPLRNVPDSAYSSAAYKFLIAEWYSMLLNKMEFRV